MIFGSILTKICQKEVIITEKFALLNLLKVLEGLTANTASANGVKTDTQSADAEKQTAAAPVQDGEQKPNFMAEVLARHERISNRVYSNGKK